MDVTSSLQSHEEEISAEDTDTAQIDHEALLAGWYAIWEIVRDLEVIREAQTDMLHW